jgi:hypothetical protein
LFIVLNRTEFASYPYLYTGNQIEAYEDPSAMYYPAPHTIGEALAKGFVAGQAGSPNGPVLRREWQGTASL